MRSRIVADNINRAAIKNAKEKAIEAAKAATQKAAKVKEEADGMIREVTCACLALGHDTCQPQARIASLAVWVCVGCCQTAIFNCTRGPAGTTPAMTLI